MAKSDGAEIYLPSFFFLKEVENLALGNESAPKAERLAPKSRVTNVADIQKKPAKESKKILTDAIRRKTFAAGTINRAGRQSTLKNNRATITSRPKPGAKTLTLNCLKVPMSKRQLRTNLQNSVVELHGLKRKTGI